MPDWEKISRGSKQGFDTVWSWADKIGAPVNKLTNKIGSEAFWPTTLDKESEKAARILQSFCKDGFYSAEDKPTEEARNLARYSKQRVLKKIPPTVIKNAKGLAIFTVMRTGLWVSGAGGSGVLLARMENGEWSPPSGILIHTAAAGFVFGADIYDCVVVINSDKALEAFRAIRVTLGGELSAVAGPVGVGAVVDVEIHGKTPPVFTYMKSRGFYAGLGANGTLIVERKDENARFYKEELRASDILRGDARHVPTYDIRMLMATIKASQGDTDVDADHLPDNRPTPGDLDLERMDDPLFGLPMPDDPDPFGVHALEEEGLEIREAGTGVKPTSEVFEYKPAPSSLAHHVIHRKSLSKTAGSPPLPTGSGQFQQKHKMSNPRMVYYADDSTQTVTAEEREQEIEREAAARADIARLEREAQVADAAAEDQAQPPATAIPKRRPVPSLPARQPPPSSVQESPLPIDGSTTDENTTTEIHDETPAGESSQEPQGSHIELVSAEPTPEQPSVPVRTGPYTPLRAAEADTIDDSAGDLNATDTKAADTGTVEANPTKANVASEDADEVNLDASTERNSTSSDAADPTPAVQSPATTSVDRKDAIPGAFD